ncbi:hypothetical protein AVEN_258558-1, partial [Araneus ventricosus]
MRTKSAASVKMATVQQKSRLARFWFHESKSIVSVQRCFCLEYRSCQSPIIRVKYEIRTYDDFVVKGNTAVLKCYVPSSVQDFVPVISWETDEGFTIQRSSSD